MTRFPVLALTLISCTALMACDNKSGTASADTTAQSVAAEAPKAGGADELPEANDTPLDPAVDPSAPAPAGEVFNDNGHEGNAGPPADMPVKSDVPPPSRAVFSDSACRYDAWVGNPVDEKALKETGRPYRVLKPGDMMTMDHNPDRINVERDDKNVVTRVWCG